MNWTAAERKDVRRYKAGQVLVFHSDVKEARKNEFVTVLRTEEGKVICQTQRGKEVAFTGKQAGAFGVFAKRSMEVAPGDQLLMLAKRNERGLEVTAGDVGVVKKVDRAGRVFLEDGRTLPANYRQFKHGYAMTAHRSQGKTVDAVIVAADRMEGELFFVAVSRAREFLQVITSNLGQLRDSVGADSTRMSATELTKQKEGQERRRQRHTVWGKAKLWARKTARAWQQKIFKVEKTLDATERRDLPRTRTQTHRGIVRERER